MTNTVKQPKFLLFAQHGWSDNGNDIGRLAKALVTPETLVFAPSLGLLNTYWRIVSLIEKVEKLAKEKIALYPELPLKIMGHSMGGLIWLEVLNRHPEWWQKVHSLVVIGSPIGGANLARIIDPLGMGIGIARDLGKNRRPIAEKIAREIPTLSIASDLGNGSDGMVALEATKFAHSRFVCVDRIPHAHLKCHSAMIPIIQEFWSQPKITSLQTDFTTKTIDRLRRVPGMTDGNHKYLERAQIAFKLPQEIVIRTFTNLAGVYHIFVTNEANKCLYAGYVGWLHLAGLQNTLQDLQDDLI